MRKYLEVLKKCPLFFGIEEENLTSMLGCIKGQIMNYEKGQYIFSEGNTPNGIGIVLDGKVQIIRLDYYGNRSIVAEIEKAQLFGESFACAQVERLPVSAVATENTCVMLMDVFRVVNHCSCACDFHNRLIRNLLKAVSNKNLTLNKKIEVISKRTTREKLLTYLLLQAKEKGSNSFDIPYDRQGLADYLEVDRSGLSAEIGKLRKEGILDSKNKHFVLKEI